MTKKLKKKTRIILISAISVFLAALLILSGVGIYFGVKNKNKGGSPAIVDPLAWSTDSWNGIDISSSELKSEYAGRTDSKTITSAASFIYFIDSVNEGNTYEGKTVYLNSNIDLSGYEIDSIGSIDHPFKGTFDGGYYTIQNTNINGNGLFNYTENATIKNLGLYNAKITGADSVGGLVGHAKNTNIENSFVRLGEVNGSNVVGGLVGVYESDNGRFSITNSFADTHLRGVTVGGLVGKVNTQQTKENEVEIASSYYTYGNKAIGLKDYAKETNILRAKKKQDFNNEEWSYSAKYSDNTTWTDYANVENSTELDFTYPLLRQYVKVTTTGSFYENVTINETTGEVVDASSLSESISKAKKSDELNINVIVKKVFADTTAIVDQEKTVKISSVTDATIQRTTDNTESVIASKENSHLILGEENADTILTIDGNSENVESSSSLIVAYGDNVEMHSNVVLQNNVNNIDGVGGGMLIYANETDITLNGGTITNCEASETGGGIAVVGSNVTLEGVTISNCFSTGMGGGISLVDSLDEEDAELMTARYGKKRKVQLVDRDITGDVYVQIVDSGTVTIQSSASIVGCATNGGAGAIKAGTVNMYGGVVAYNVAFGSNATNGGAIACNTFTMSGGLLLGNYCNNAGGAVICGNMEITGGEIAFNGQRLIEYKYGETKGYIQEWVASEDVNYIQLSYLDDDSVYYDLKYSSKYLNSYYDTYFSDNACVSKDTNGKYYCSGMYDRYRDMVSSSPTDKSLWESYYDKTGKYVGPRTKSGGALYCSSNTNSKATLNINNGGDVENSDIYIHHNYAQEQGGAIYGGTKATITISECYLRNNQAGRNGGAVFVRNGETNEVSTLNIKNMAKSIKYNHAGLNGGAIYVDKAAIGDMYGFTIYGCTAGNNGGGIYIGSAGSGVENKTVILGQFIDSDGDGDNEVVGVNIGMYNASYPSDNPPNEAYFGGGIYSQRALDLTYATVSYNKATHGGGVYLTAELSITGGTIKHNEATGSGGGVYCDGSLTFKDGSAVYKNKADAGGGVSAKTLVINEGVEISQNRARAGGGAILNNLYMYGGEISENEATGSGGGVYFGYDTETDEETGETSIKEKTEGKIYGGTFSNNDSASYGGVMYAGSPRLELLIHDGTFSNNDAGLAGGVIYARNKTISISIYDGLFKNNEARGDNGYAGRGGVAYVDYAELKIFGGEFISNTARYRGGVICAGYSASPETIVKPLYISGGTFTSNSTSSESVGYGGAIYSARTLYGSTDGNSTITFKNNTSSHGGAICVSGTSDGIHWWAPTIFESNSASVTNKSDVVVGGGAIYLEQGTIEQNARDALSSEVIRSSVIANSTFISNKAENKAGAAGYGGAIYAGKDLTLFASGITMSSNEATNGGFISSSAHLVIDGGTYKNNYAVNGGAVYSDITTKINFTPNVTIQNNPNFEANGSKTEEPTTITTEKGGAIYSKANLTINSGTYSNNHVTSSGGAIYSAGQLQLLGGEIYDNSANNGGGVFGIGSTTIDNATINFNEARGATSDLTTGNGGGIYATGELTVVGDLSALSVIGRNTATNNGGGIYAGNSVKLEGYYLQSNVAGNDGGGIYSTGTVEMTGGRISDNTATNGGGIFISTNSDSERLYANGGTISNNKATENGGGVYAEAQIYLRRDSSGVYISDSNSQTNFEDNIALQNGGAIYGTKLMKLYGTDGSISGNRARKFGGAIYAENDVKIIRGTFEYNSAVRGGAIYGSDASEIIIGDTSDLDNLANNRVTFVIKNNTANGGLGGAIYSAGTLTMNAGTISDNTATAGGGIFSTGKVTMTGGTISNNKATNGGAIHGNLNSKIYIGTSGSTDNSKLQIYSNSATDKGGAIFTQGTFNLYSGTIGSSGKGNTAAAGGGLYLTGTAEITGGVISHNTANGKTQTDADNVEHILISADGGGVYSTGTVTMTGGEISHNSATNGGGVYAQELILRGTEASKAVLIYNSATGNGGGAMLASLDLSGYSKTNYGNITLNKADGNGGGVYFYDIEENQTVSISDFGYIQKSEAKNGGGIYVDSSDLKINMTGGSISSNSATNGGGVYSTGTVTMTGGTISYNTATNGGGIYDASGLLTINGGVYENTYREKNETTGEYEIIEDDYNDIYLSGKSHYITFGAKLSKALKIKKEGLSLNDKVSADNVEASFIGTSTEKSVYDWLKSNGKHINLVGFMDEGEYELGTYYHTDEKSYIVPMTPVKGVQVHAYIVDEKGNGIADSTAGYSNVPSGLIKYEFANNSGYINSSTHTFNLPKGTLLPSDINSKSLSVGGFTFTAEAGSKDNYDYIFQNWSYYDGVADDLDGKAELPGNDIGIIEQDSEIIFAVYLRQLKTCEVEFRVNDENCGTVSETTVNPVLNSTINKDGATVTFEYTDENTNETTITVSASANEGYQFKNWTVQKYDTGGNLVDASGETTLTEKLVFTANFELANYVVTWLNWDETELETDENVTIEDYVQFNGGIPARNSGVDYDYEFINWVDKSTRIVYSMIADGKISRNGIDAIKVSSDMTLVAQYKATLRKYTVTFVNADGTELQKGDCDYGSRPTYSREIPTYPASMADPRKQYTFMGWTREDDDEIYLSDGLPTVTGEATYKAAYFEQYIKRQYKFNFDYGTLTIDGVSNASGATLNVPFEISYEQAFSQFDSSTINIMGSDSTLHEVLYNNSDTSKVFVGWERNEDSETETVTYTAQFKDAYTLTLETENQQTYNPVSVQVTYGSITQTYGSQISFDASLKNEDKIKVANGSTVQFFTQFDATRQIVKFDLQNNSTGEYVTIKTWTAGTDVTGEIPDFTVNANEFFKISYLPSRKVTFENVNENIFDVTTEGLVSAGNNSYVVTDDTEIEFKIYQNGIETNKKFIGFKDFERNYYGPQSPNVVEYVKYANNVYTYKVKAGNLTANAYNEATLEIVLVEVVSVTYTGGFTGSVSLTSEQGKFVEILDSSSGTHSINLFAGKWNISTTLSLDQLKEILDGSGYTFDPSITNSNGTYFITVLSSNSQ